MLFRSGPARKALGVPTAFNLLGPLTNPAGANRQIVGVARPELTELLARALALDPELLFLDEPTAGLDPERSEAFCKLIATLKRELGLTVVMVTHDPELAKRAQRVVTLRDGRPVEAA